MKKEIIGVVFLGFVFGLIIVFGFRTAKTTPKKEVAVASPTSSKNKMVPEETSPLSLSLLLPEDHSVSSKENIDLTGKTTAKAIVVVIYPDGEKIIEADEVGNFKTEIALIGGDNEIEVIASDQEGNQTTQKINVIYSTAKLD